VRIKEASDRLPGGVMLGPLVLGALCKTFAPNAPAYFRGFTQGIMTGVIPILAVLLFLHSVADQAQRDWDRCGASPTSTF
jgi:2-keto-3-deoxygluconate permease